MDDAMFDRLARGFPKTGSRRWMVALISAATGLLGQHAARGFQLGPATCGEEGAVCTLVSGCCDGLICVTSAINTSYGICVPGEGGMISTGTTLISPFSETAVGDVSALVETASTTPAIDPQADREARIAEIRARKETRRTERKARVDSRRAKVQARKDEKRNRKREPRETPEVALAPQLQLKLQFSKADGDSESPGNQSVPIEVVRVSNRDDVEVVLTRIETIKDPAIGADLTTSQFTLGPGESYSFVSGLPTEDAADAPKDRYRWLDKVACVATIQRQGYRVKAAFSRGGENYDFVVRCDGPHVTGAVGTSESTRRRTRKRNNQQMKKR